MTEPEFIETKNSEWEKYSSNEQYPTINSVVIKETKEIGKQGIYTLTMNKVESINGLEYMAGIWASGSGGNSEVGKNYELILIRGLNILYEKSVEFENEYLRMKKLQMNNQ